MGTDVNRNYDFVAMRYKFFKTTTPNHKLYEKLMINDNKKD